MALDMMAKLGALSAILGTDLQVRIGMDTVPVVAGVIGTRKFIYDLWRTHRQHRQPHRVAGQIPVRTARRDQRKGKGDKTVYLLGGSA